MSKRKILLLVLMASLLCLGNDVYCQNDQIITERREKSVCFSLYGEVGWGLSSFHSSNTSIKPKFSSLSSVVLGAGVNMRFWKDTSHNRFAEDGLMALQAGLLYTKSGFEADDDRITGNYICVPLAIQYYPISDLYVELYGEICMNLGLSPSSVIIQGVNMDLDKHKANDFKVGIGAGYLHTFNKFGPIGISAKYLFGTRNFAENLPWKGNQLRLTVFYRFML